MGEKVDESSVICQTKTIQIITAVSIHLPNIFLPNAQLYYGCIYPFAKHFLAKRSVVRVNLSPYCIGSIGR